MNEKEIKEIERRKTYYIEHKEKIAEYNKIYRAKLKELNKDNTLYRKIDRKIKNNYANFLLYTKEEKDIYIVELNKEIEDYTNRQNYTIDTFEYDVRETYINKLKDKLEKLNIYLRREKIEKLKSKI
jgi:hypothetical protein